MQGKRDKNLDKVFIKEVLSPYLKDIFNALTHNGNNGKSYLNADRTK
jgi:hypothetical protein